MPMSFYRNRYISLGFLAVVAVGIILFVAIVTSSTGGLANKIGAELKKNDKFISQFGAKSEIFYDDTSARRFYPSDKSIGQSGVYFYFIKYENKMVRIRVEWEENDSGYGITSMSW